MKRPIFLLTFANDAQGSLRLGEEMNACWNELAGLDEAGTIDCQRMGYATLAQIYRELNRYKDQVFLLHYGGHSYGEFLQLQGTPGSSKNLGCKIGQQRFLKLAFLNGCQNYQQVETLLDHGVPVVIATTALIEDQRAVVLAQQFYQALAAGNSIRVSFASAKSFILDEYPELSNSFRVGRRFEGPKVVFEWGIYTRDEAALDWSIKDITQDAPFLRQQLREASRERHKKFTCPGGRFQYLRIEEAILSGIVDLKHPSRPLIEEQVTLNDKAYRLEQILPQLWERDCPHAVITGVGGMGKTVSLLRLWEHLAGMEDLNSSVPIFIQLNEFNNQPGKDFIRRYISKHYADLDLDALLKSSLGALERPQLILLLDGFNEITASNVELIQEINRLRASEDYPGLQLILSSRTDMRNTIQWQAFHLLELQPLTNEQIKAYLKMPPPDNTRLLELLRNPMMLSLHAAHSELPERYQAKGLLKTEVTSTGELLYNVEAMQRIKIEEQHATSLGDQAYRRFILEHLTPFIGWEMQQLGVFFLEKQGKPDEQPGLQDILQKGLEHLLTDDFFDTFDYFSHHLNETHFSDSTRRIFTVVVHQIMIQELAIFSRDGANYRFLHQNYRDYFAARHVQNHITVALYKNQVPEILVKAPLDHYVRNILGELEGEHINKTIWNAHEFCWEWSEGGFFMNNQLSGVLRMAKNIFNNSFTGYLIWNLVVIWAEKRGELSGAELCHLDLTGIQLYGVRCSRLGLVANFSGSLININNLVPTSGHKKRITAIGCSALNDTFHSSSMDGTLKVWDSVTGNCIQSFNCGYEVETIAIEEHEQYIASGPSNVIASKKVEQPIKIWDIKGGEKNIVLEGGLEDASSIAFNSKEGKIVACSWWSGIVRVWDLQTSKCILTIDEHYIGRPQKVQFSIDGNQIILLHSGGILVFHSKTGEEILGIWHNLDILDFTVSQDNMNVIGIDQAGNLSNWSLRDGEIEKIISLNIEEEIFESCFNSDSSLLCITLGDRSQVTKSLTVWSTNSGECIFRIQSSVTISSLCFAQLDKIIIAGFIDGALKGWDIWTGEEVISISGYPAGYVKSAALGHNIIYIDSYDYPVKVWDSEQGICMLTTEGHLDKRGGGMEAGNYSVRIDFDFFYLLEKPPHDRWPKTLFKAQNNPGLIIQGCLFMDLHPQSNITDDPWWFEQLQKYGCIFDDSNLEIYKNLILKHRLKLANVQSLELFHWQR